MGHSKTYLTNTEKKSYSASRLRRLKIKDENIKARIQRLKKEMTEIRGEHKHIKAGQIEVAQKINKIRRDCAQLREEAKLMFDQGTYIRRRLHIMFHILRARKSGDLVKAQKLTKLLCVD